MFSEFTHTVLRLFAAMAMALTLSAPAVPAQDSKDDGKTRSSATKPATDAAQEIRPIVTTLTVDQEDGALTFARMHHRELADLLEQLRGTSPSGFSRGIREVHLSAQRLERFREKQPARFEAELYNWKTDSEVRLLTAKWAVSQDPELEKEIRELLRARQQSRIDRLSNDREKLVVRLKQLETQIGMGTEELEADLVNEWNRLAKQATTTARAQRRSTSKKTTANTKPKSNARKPGDSKAPTKQDR